MTMHKVLVPLDGSEFSRQILPHIRNFLDPDDNELILLRVAQPPEGITGAPARPTGVELPLPMYESERDAELTAHPIYASQAWDSFETSLVDELQTDVVRLQDAGYAVSVAVRFGDPAQEIVDFVEDESVDLVTMATHGRTGLGRLLFGSVTEQVLRNLSVPIMLVRPFEQPAGTRVPGIVLAERLADDKALHMAVATDGSPFAQTATVFTGDLARALDAQVSLLAAFSEEEGAVRGQEILDEARELVGDLEIAPTSVPLVGYADEVIIQHLAKTPIDLLVIGAFGDRGATRFLIGATAQRLVQHAPTSVLMVKGQRPAFDRILTCTTVGDEIVVDVAAELARAVGAELQVLHVVPPSAAMYLTLPDAIDVPLSEVLEQDTPLARHLGVCIDRLDDRGFGRDVVKVRRGALPDAIFQGAREGAFDLIVVGSQSGPVQNRYFIGSIANRVVKHAHRSVLVVRTTRQ